MARYTAGDAKSAADTIARAACVICGFVGPQNELCSDGVDMQNPDAVAEARAGCDVKLQMAQAAKWAA